MVRPSWVTLARMASTRHSGDPPYGGGHGQLGQTLQTDVYKLGLAILRCLAPGLGVPSTRDVARLHSVLDPEGVTWSRGRYPTTRTTATVGQKDLRVPAEGHREGLVPPKIEQAGLLTPIVLTSPQGQEGRITWRIERATRVSVLIGENSPHTHCSAQRSPSRVRLPRP